MKDRKIKRGHDDANNCLVNLVRDWGTGLDVHLYEEAFAHRYGGPERVKRDMEVVYDSHGVGRQPTRVLDPTTALKITTLRKDLAAYESHLRRFLDHTSLERFLWANIARRSDVARSAKIELTEKWMTKR